MFIKDLKTGSVGKEVFGLQIFLEKFGYGDFVPTGIFGPKTLVAVMKFQADYKIPNTGYVGILTRTKLNELISQNKREAIYIEAVSCLNIDVSPEDVVPDEYDCANSVTIIVKNALGSFPEGSISTYFMYRALLASNGFMRVDSPLPGDIIISPTGYGNGKLSNGHVGLVGEDEKVMSNSSDTGLFTENYTLKTWKKRYVDIGGYPLVYFRKV